MKKIWLSFMLSALVLPATTQAAGLFRISENVNVPAGMEVSEVVVINASAEISGRVTGNAVVLNGNVNLKNTARVAGDVVCLGGKISADPGAQVTGTKVEIGGNIMWKALPFFSIGKLLLWSFIYKVVTAVFLLVFSIFLILMWPRQIQAAAQEAAADLFKSSLVGILAIAFLIPLAIGFAITLFGIPISLVLVLFLIIANFFGMATMSYLVGHKTMAAISPLLAVVLGLLILKIIHFVPFLGGLLYFLISLPGLGAVLLSRFGTNQPWLGAVKVKTVRRK